MNFPTIPGLKMRFDNPRFIHGLIDLCQFIKPNSIGVEIGSYKGESSWIFAQSGKFKTLYCIDSWQDDPQYHEKMTAVEQTFDKITRSFSCIHKIKSTSLHAARLWSTGVAPGLAGATPATFDFVYIDGDHHYESVLADIKAWLPKIKSDGIIAGHDYNWYKGKTKNPKTYGVSRAVRDMFGKPDIWFCDSSWLKFISRIK